MTRAQLLARLGAGLGAGLGTALLLAGPTALAQRHPMPETAKVYIIWPADGQVVRGGFWVRMGLSEGGIAPAGVEKPMTGHHHLLIDVDLPDLNKPIPNDRNHLHFGLGQTEARLDLPPGRHTLQMLLGDENHVPHDPPLMSKRITVTVLPAPGG
ncbi:ATPase [Roseicella frigidaeris]|uniref:ATPase n=2 Tax=Roseicella frigidaeris TaxID=2230885 RepID=A0A327M8N9_9PROT|nr:ATPase [Roseicella frigidaeris]